MKLVGIKMQEKSRSHKDAAGAHRAQVKPNRAPTELVLQNMQLD